jgi:predicted metal-dependent hydrolase
MIKFVNVLNIFHKKILNDPQLGEVLFRKNNRAGKYIIRMKPNAVTVTIPWGGNYSCAEQFFKENRMLILQKTAELKSEDTHLQQDTALRYQASNYLPAEINRLALEHGFHYKAVKIRKSKTRWGSCSSKGTINLSFYLMLLPSHLIEYVLLHELCHTIEMNHGAAFWTLLDRHTNGESKKLQKELRKYHIPR